MNHQENKILNMLTDEVRGIRTDLKERDRLCVSRGETIVVLASRQGDMLKRMNNRRKAATDFALRTLSHIIAAVGAAVLVVYLLT